MDERLITTGDGRDIRLKEGNMNSVFIWTESCIRNGREINDWAGYKIFCRTWGTRIKWMS